MSEVALGVSGEGWVVAIRLGAVAHFVLIALNEPRDCALALPATARPVSFTQWQLSGREKCPPRQFQRTECVLISRFATSAAW